MRTTSAGRSVAIGSTLLRRLDRMELYTARARRSIKLGNVTQALAELAEVAEIGRGLWHELAKNYEHIN